MKEENKFRTGKEAEEFFESLCQSLEKASIEAEEYYGVEFKRFSRLDKSAGDRRFDFVEDVWDIVEILNSLKSRARRVFQRGKDKGFFK